MPTPLAARVSRAEVVARELQREIGDGHARGERLGTKLELRERFGVAVATMNEAIRLLETRAIVETRPGPGGGVFVASRPPQVRLGALDLWFSGAGTDPLELFEARAHLEDLLTRVAVDRAGPQDVRDMEWAVDEMQRADDPRAFLDANMRLHLAIARASRIPVLAGMYEAIVAILQASLTRAVLLDGHEEMYRHNIAVHQQIVAAIRESDAEALEKVLHLHRMDLVRAVAPERSPS
jgi:DNA-binding FadR family transcriptional regulator